jgi:DNA modification methylase
MTGSNSFFSLLSEQQMEQIIQNPGDFGVTDPEYLIVMNRAGSRKNEDDRSGDRDDTVDSGRV